MIKQTIPVLAALAAAFSGCNQNENLPGGNTDDRVAIRVSSDIDVADGVKKTNTRAVNGAWDRSDQIGIFMLDGTSVDEYANIPYETASGNGGFAPLQNGTVIYLPVDDSGRDFVAYYPYRGEATDDNYTIDLSDQGNQSAIDFMTAEKTDRTEGSEVISKVQNIRKADPDVKFRFRHRLCKLRLKIEAGNGFDGSADLKDMKVFLTNQQTQDTYNVLTDDAVAIVPGNETIKLLTVADGQHSEAIVFPSDDYKDMQFEFHVAGHGVPYVWSLRESQKATKFEEGKEYLYNIRINKTGLEVTASIEPWGEGGEESGDATMPGDFEKPDMIGTKEAVDAMEGDYLMADGSFVGGDAQLTPEQIEACIGVVFHLGTSEADQKAGYKYGYAMAMADVPMAGNPDQPGSFQWSNSNKKIEGIPDISHMSYLYYNAAYPPEDAAQYDKLDGRTYTDIILQNETASDKYPAAAAALDFGKTEETEKYKAPESTSGWYLPSAGQWWCILENLAGAQRPNGATWYVGSFDPLKRLNEHLQYGQQIPEESNLYGSSNPRSSSPISQSNVWSFCVSVMSGGKYPSCTLYYAEEKRNSYRVRPVLAF